MEICRSIFVFVIISLLLSCQTEPPATPMELEKQPLIPIPVSVKGSGSSFRLTKEVKITYLSEQKEVQPIATYLTRVLRPATGFPFKLTTEKRSGEKMIELMLVDSKEYGKEGYELMISETGIELKANKPAGLFYGVQTLRQLLPAKIEASEMKTGPWEIASGTINDQPYYDYRGTMLDVSRHFFGVDDLKRHIEMIAAFKINHLHLHLADDQGWRIEIKSWPNLAKHGGSTEVGGGKGGYYTQAQYQEIVAFAQAHFITIVPEIDMPGHTNAALASYAELNCDNKVRALYTGTDVGFSTLCTSKDIVYKFVDDVFSELVALTPGPYIHIGGDESDVTEEKDYIKFVNRVQEIVNKHGKQMMGWDDITAASLKNTTVAQHWRSSANAAKAKKQGVKIVMSPAKKAYLDMQYDTTTTLGLHWAAYIEVDSAYLWNPETYVSGISKEDILGLEAPLWTETITNMNEIEYMVFPRLMGYAEIGWSPLKGRNWAEYRQRLGKFKERLDIMDIDFYASKRVPWRSSSAN